MYIVKRFIDLFVCVMHIAIYKDLHSSGGVLKILRGFRLQYTQTLKKKDNEII